MRKGWVKTTVEKLVNQKIIEKPLDGNHGEIHPKKSDFTESGIPFVMASDLVNGTVNQETCNFISREQADSLRKGFAKNGDVLLSHKGTIGRSAILQTSLDYVVLTPQVTYYRILDNSVLDNRFLYYSFHSPKFQNEIKKIAGAGSTRAYIGITQQLQLHIPIAPLPEQKRIVAIMDEAFEGIDRAIANAEKNLANARELFESYLNFKLLAVASGKPTQNLSCITELIIDCEHKTAPTQETGIPSIRTPNIGKGYLIFDNVNRVSEETYELWTRRGKPEPGDLILAREAPAGNVGVIPPDMKVCLGQRTVLIRPNKESVDSQYLAFLLLHPLMQKRLLAKSTGATVQHVNMKDIRELLISELPPVQAQRDCIEELEQLQSQVNSLESIYRQKLAALNELKQSILQKAFTGELTADTANQTTKAAKEGIAA
ncbi:type 1 restriction-modification system specificity subunit (plasmid) [Calothrix sp. NIES-4101]|nr:type 1 restriction-modification system specificity subunit [Calothrix sp. NIES-4101]